MSKEVAVFECNIGHRRVVCKVAVLPGSGGSTPFLMSKEMLKSLGAVLDTTQDTMHFKHLGVTVQLGVTSRGHYAVPLFESDTEYERTKHTARVHSEVMMNEGSFDSQTEASDRPDRALSYVDHGACNVGRQSATTSEPIEEQGLVGSVMGKTLDQMQDAGQDSPRIQSIPGTTNMTEGKYKNNPVMNLAEIYTKDKSYVKWVREHIGGHSATSLRMLKAYIQARDQNKKARVGMQSSIPGMSSPPWRNTRGYDMESWTPTSHGSMGSAGRTLYASPPASNWSMVPGGPTRMTTEVREVPVRRRQRDDDMDTSAPVPPRVLDGWRVMTQDVMALQEVKRRAMESNITESIVAAHMTGQQAVVPKLVSRVMQANTDREMEHF